MKSFLKRSRLLRFFPRIMLAANYYNRRYCQILKWGFLSREFTNFTYDLTDTNIRYLALTLSVATKKPYSEVYGYIQEARKDNDLRRHIIDLARKPEHARAADPRCDFGRRLGWYAVARAIKPKVVVETGVAEGLGAVLLCSALIRNRDQGHPGFYYGTDIDPAAGYLLTGKYKNCGELLYGDSLETLKGFGRRIDLFINDSDHSPQYEYQEYLAIKSKLGKKAMILGDNSHASDRLAVFSIENGRQFMFFKEVPKDHWYPGGGIGISF